MLCIVVEVDGWHLIDSFVFLSSSNIVRFFLFDIPICIEIGIVVGRGSLIIRCMQLSTTEPFPSAISLLLRLRLRRNGENNKNR